VTWNTHLNYKIGLCLLVQVGYTIYGVMVRPFDLVKDNIFETLNDLNYTTLIIILFWYQKSDDWSSVLKLAYIYIMIYSNIMFALVGICKFDFSFKIGELVWTILKM
jgi:hypothetical protein